MINYIRIASISKKDYGITLIALVITIIVLLILAGVSISLLSGDNGILQKAKIAKENTDSAQIKERIQLAYYSALTGGQGSYTKESLEDELKKEFGENNYNVDDSDSTDWILTAQEQSVTIPAGTQDDQDNGKVTLKVGTTNLKEVADLTTLYGETTDYSSVNGIQWQLFYDDDSWIYLISRDFVPVDKLPCKGNTGYSDTDLHITDGAYRASFCSNSFDDYVYKDGTPYRDFENAPSLLSTSKSYPVISKYLRWLQNDYNLAGYVRSITAIAYMMDTEKWCNFSRDDDRFFRNRWSDIRNVYRIL